MKSSSASRNKLLFRSQRLWVGGDGDTGRLGSLPFVVAQRSFFSACVWDNCRGQGSWEVRIGSHTLRAEWPLPDSVSRRTLVGGG